MKQIMVHVMIPHGESKTGRKTRFISEKYFNLDHEHGRIGKNSIWMTDADYHSALQSI